MRVLDTDAKSVWTEGSGGERGWRGGGTKGRRHISNLPGEQRRRVFDDLHNSFGLGLNKCG